MFRSVIVDINLFSRSLKNDMVGGKVCQVDRLSKYEIPISLI